MSATSAGTGIWALHIIINDITEPLRENVRKIDRDEPARAGTHHSLLVFDQRRGPGALPHSNGQYLTKDTYARLFIHELLPATCEQVIYLDADMVILGDVAVLHDTAWGVETSVHAVQDLFVPWVSMPSASSISNAEASRRKRATSVPGCSSST